MPPKFKPKQPKARKPKTEEQKAVARQRNKAEDERIDDVAVERRRKQAVLNDPRLFLTEGIGSMAQNEILRQYNRVLAYNKAKEEAPPDPIVSSLPPMTDYGPVLSPGSPRDTPRFPPGVLIKKKNPNKAERAHNKEVRALQNQGNINPFTTWNPDVAGFDEPSFIPDEVLRANEMPDQIGQARMGEISFTPDDTMGSYVDDWVEGDYFQVLQQDRELTQSEAEEGVRASYKDIMSSQSASRRVVLDRPRQEDFVVRMTDEEKAEIIAQAKEIQGKMKQARTQEEKDYYKRALKDLKEGETSAVKSRRKQREEALIAGAPVVYRAPNVPKRKYWGPANIVDGMIQTAREVGVRPLTAEEQQSYMGGGTTGQTERYSSDSYSDTFNVREYQPPEGSDVLRLRKMDDVPEWGQYEEKPASNTDVSGYEYPVEQLTRYMGSMERANKAPKQRVLSKVPSATLKVEEVAPSMLTKTGKGKYRYDTGETNAQVRTYGRKRDPKTGQYVKYKG